MKRCAKCKEEKEVEYFSKNPQQKDGRHVYCKDCVKTYHGQYYKEHREGLIDAGRKRREANPEGFAAYHKRYRLVARNKIKNQRLVKAYGITLDAWYVLFKKQGRQCAICKTP